MNNHKIQEIRRLCKGKGVNEIVSMICDKKIGSGLYRDVYECKQCPELVVKIEKQMHKGQFANATEWRHWIDNENSWLGTFMAPCEMINETGQVLIQQRVEHRTKKEYPKEIPSHFTDMKYANYGWIEDKFVCCDYSFLLLTSGSKKMRKAKWWGLLPDKK